MTVRFSTGVRNALAGGRGFGALFNLGSLLVFSGTQPLTADSAVVGTHLGTATAASGALTQETPASGSITITGSGTSVLTLTVGTFNIIPGIVVPWNGTTTQTAADLCDAINRVGMFSATVSGAVVTFKPPPGAGAAYNAAAVAHTGTVTATYVNMSGGVTPVNGLVWTPPSLGVVSKSGTWSFNGLAAGTAGWFRLIGSEADAGAALAAAPWLPRVDGSIAVSGADLNLSNISIAIGAPNTIDSFTLTIPAQ